jgi:hypothetical protein
MDENRSLDNLGYLDPVLMNDVREELGQEIVDTLTDSMLGKIRPLSLQAKIRETLNEVRAENYDVVMLEIELAMQRVMLEHCMEELTAQKELSDIRNEKARFSAFRADLLQGMLDYKVSQPKRNAINGAKARHAATDDLKKKILEAWRENSRKYDSPTAFANDWVEKDVGIKRPRTIVDWIKKSRDPQS